MADWKTQYLASLKARDESEKAEAEIYERYTILADRNAELRAELRNIRTSTENEAPPSNPTPAPLVSYGFRRQTSPQPPNESATVAQLRQDFAKAQQDRAELQNQVEVLEKEAEQNAIKTKHDQKTMTHLSHSNNQLATKLKDKESELRGKRKLLIDVQDENATLNLQLNMAEDRAEGLKNENKELVDRWMARMGREADMMNEEGKFK